ncbi:MAG: TetR/AcrR family transcriptional regulator [Muribaculaceae bacterium]|nr:TetR/AcrR family transcriptional regulator [Muribaculaceae bacterium]
MVLKTRERLIEVARQLFTNKGIENTTMTDIANASDKGRRTIYTYFKNKREIYNAVIEQESEQLVSQLRDINSLKASPTEKLRNFLVLRFEMFNDTLSRQDSFRALFNREVKRVGRIRKLVTSKEIEILKAILDEGVAKLEFQPEQVNRLIPLIQMLLQGIDCSIFRGNTTEEDCNGSITNENIINFILEGLKL